MLPLLPLLAAAGPPDSEGADLPAMVRDYGWSVVASVVSSARQGDGTPADVHARLDAMGLDELQVPVRVDPALSLQAGPLTACGWNQGVVCRLALPPGAPDEDALQVRCDGEGTAVVLRMVTDPAPTSETAGVAWVEGVDKIGRAHV
jgi:hypothetical protein